MSKIAKKRTQNILDKAKEQIKKAKDKVKNTRPSELAEVDYTNYEDFSSDEFPNKPWPEVETLPVEPFPEDGDTSSQDNNLTDIQKRTQNMLLNPEEQVKKAVEQGQIEIPDWEKDLFAAAAEVDHTSSQDNKGINLNLWDALDTLVDFSNRVPPVDQMVSTDDKELKDAGEAVNQVTDTIGETLSNVLPEYLDNNLGLALFGILAVAGIPVFLYILWSLKPLFEIGSNVSEK